MRELLPLPSKSILPTSEAAKYLTTLRNQLVRNEITEEHLKRFNKLQLVYYGYGSSWVPIGYLVDLHKRLDTLIVNNTFHLLENANEPVFGIYRHLLETILNYNKLLTQLNNFITLPDLLTTIYKVPYQTLDEYIVIINKGYYEFSYLNHYDFSISTRIYTNISKDPLFIKYLQKYSPESLL